MALLHGAMGSDNPLVHTLTSVGRGQWGSFSTMPHCNGQWAVALLLYSAALHGVVGSGDPSINCLTPWSSGLQGSFSRVNQYIGEWAMDILYCTTTMQWALARGGGGRSKYKILS